jgi:hypothetical protein
MRVAVMVLRGRLRRHWISWLALSVLVAVAGGFFPGQDGRVSGGLLWDGAVAGPHTQRHVLVDAIVSAGFPLTCASARR